MAGVAEMERNLICERTRLALAHLKAQGQRTGSIPYGSMLAPDGKTLLKDPNEQKVIRLAKRLRKQGKSLRYIAQELSKRGFTSRTGKVFYAQQISRMLT